MISIAEPSHASFRDAAGALHSPLAQNVVLAPPGLEQKEIKCADNRRNLRLIRKEANQLPHCVQSRKVDSRNVQVLGSKKLSEGTAPPPIPSHLPNN